MAVRPGVSSQRLDLFSSGSTGTDKRVILAARYTDRLVVTSCYCGRILTRLNRLMVAVGYRHSQVDSGTTRQVVDDMTDSDNACLAVLEAHER